MLSADYTEILLTAVTSFYQVQNNFSISISLFHSVKQSQTRMHSSRMRTGCSLTVCCSLLPRGVSVLGGVSAPGGGGVCSREGGCVCSRGLMSAPRGVCSWGGVCSGGGVCSRRGWVSALGGVSQHALRQTPLPPCGQTHACENITLAQLRCGR